MAKVWTEQEEIWLVKNARHHGPLALVRAFCQAFPDSPRTLDAIRYKLNALSVNVKHGEIAQSAILHIDEWRTLSKAAYPYPAKKPGKPRKKKSTIKSYLIWPDTHVPHEDRRAVRAVLSMMDDVDFDGLVVIGDFLDMESISHWNKSKRFTSEGLRLKEQYARGNALLDEICRRLPKGTDMRWLDGNHEDWYYQLIEEYPALDGLMGPHEQLKLKERGFSEIKRYGQPDSYTRLGKLWIVHGTYTNMHHAKKHFDMMKHNVMYGHLHDQQLHSSSSNARELAFQAYCIGCLADVAPDYMRGRPNNWVHGFAVVHLLPNGKFDVDMKRIVNGQFVYNGKLYEG